MDNSEILKMRAETLFTSLPIAKEIAIRIYNKVDIIILSKIGKVVKKLDVIFV